MGFFFLVKMKKRDTLTETWSNQHWSCWFYPWCIIVRVHSVHSAPCESPLTLYSSDTAWLLSVSCHCDTHTHTRAKYSAFLYFMSISQSTAKMEGMRKKCFSSTIKTRRGIICFPSICVCVSCSERIPQRNTAGTDPDVSCNKLIVLTNFQLKEF